MGDLFSGKKTTTSDQKFDTGPSSFQKPYLDQSFKAAQDIYNSSKGSAAYQGDTYAGMTAEQKAQLDRVRGYATGAATQGASAISNSGMQQVGATNGMATDNLSRFTALAGTDPTQANIAAATAYANNPAIDGQIDAASRDVGRNLYEQQLPGIDRAASGSGNINSSRAGIAAGVAQRGAGDRIADISSQIRGDAYNRGLSQASNDRASQLGAYSAAAGQYADLNQQGISAIGAGTAAGNSALDRETAANVTNQVDRQGGLDALLAKWKAGDIRASELLQRYNSVVGASQIGSSGTSSGTGTEKTSGNILGQLAGAATAGASLYKAFSDRRLKRSIRKLAEMPDGLGLYSFRYLWGGPVQIGCMADEVALLRPNALGPRIFGFATVRYGLL